MTGVFCFSGSGHSRAVADALSQMLKCKTTEITSDAAAMADEDTAVVVFPVYCQNIPKPVRRFLVSLRTRYVVLIAVYGRISCGNVLYEAQKLVRGEVIAGAYIPIGHTFLNGDCSFDKDFLLPIVGRIETPEKAKIPKRRKDLLAYVFPDLRSRMSVRLTKGSSCTGCGLCERLCPTGAIRQGRITSRCIRCLRCVSNCPQNALQYRNSPILERYLRTHSSNEYILCL